jgi:hypothetical protein
MKLVAYRTTAFGQALEPQFVVEELEVSEAMGKRTRGLIGHAPLKPGQGMVLRPCRWIHMFGMSFAIDVLYVNRRGRIVAVSENLRPNRIDRPVLQAAYVVELPSGAIRNAGLHVGDSVQVEP